MKQADLSMSNLIEELQLRRWARENYVPRTQRKASWHPVVLDEMVLKEQELQELVQPNSLSAMFVPLAPTPVSRVDRRHLLPNEPNLATLVLELNQLPRQKRLAAEFE